MYGMEYSEFVKSIIKTKSGMPINTAKKILALNFELIPDSKKNPEIGAIKFSALPHSSFLKCFECTSLKCINSLRYTFRDRYMNISSPSKKNYTAGWIIEGKDPMGTNGKKWSYSCGASRYSLQSLINP